MRDQPVYSRISWSQAWCEAYITRTTSGLTFSTTGLVRGNDEFGIFRELLGIFLMSIRRVRDLIEGLEVLLNLWLDNVPAWDGGFVLAHLDTTEGGCKAVMVGVYWMSMQGL